MHIKSLADSELLYNNIEKVRTIVSIRFPILVRAPGQLMNSVFVKQTLTTSDTRWTAMR